MERLGHDMLGLHRDTAFMQCIHVCVEELEMAGRTCAIRPENRDLML